ncbi:Uncharacterized protein FWK35_00020007 [Aphis craccivora]|uniref:HAT C-terminal dimerisation domain-containing protein n=1 Tax=Aphis craccivora TaxID=307492 RepID=A0A6G0Z0C1_APHCR|nr:Uncharacterized protein FWK35_00020007 [Aphis craccivora]
MTLASSISIVRDVEMKLTPIVGAQGKTVKTKESFEDLPEDLTLNGLVYFKYAPITSVDVERSFSINKNMLTNNRRAFKFDNIRKCLIVQSNFTGEDEKNETDHTQ